MVYWSKQTTTSSSLTHSKFCVTDLLGLLVQDRGKSVARQILVVLIHRLSLLLVPSERRESRFLFTSLHPVCLHSELKSYFRRYILFSLSSILCHSSPNAAGLSTNKWCNSVISVARLHGTLHERTGKCISDYLNKRLLLCPFAIEEINGQPRVQAVLILAGQCDWHLESPELETLGMRVTPFLVSYTRLTRYSARSPGHGFITSECHLQLHVKSHARAGLMCSAKALCNSSTPDFPGAPSSQLGVSIILMPFTIITAIIFTAFAASLARDSDANRKSSVHGAIRRTVDTQSGTTGAHWWFECSTQQRTEVGTIVNALSTQRACTSSFGGY